MAEPAKPAGRGLGAMSKRIPALRGVSVSGTTDQCRKALHLTGNLPVPGSPQLRD